MTGSETTQEFLRKVGKYTLLDVLGSGATGVVYHAHLSGPMGFRKQVALKTIRTELADCEQGYQSLINEARLGGHLQHRNIVSTLDFGQTEDTFYVAMEYVQGFTLDRIVRRIPDLGPIPAEAIAGIAVQICSGLSYAHAAMDDEGRPLFLVHRDLKPQNVMVSTTGVVKLMDFGIAEAANNLFRDEPGHTAGTPAYMSPEQIRGNPLDQRSDLFSLASLLAEMITGQQAFRGSDVSKTLERIAAVEVGEALLMAGMHMPHTVSLLEKAWQRAPQERFASAKEMRIAIHRACRASGDRPLGEEPLARWLRRWMSDAAGDGPPSPPEGNTVYSLDDGWSEADDEPLPGLPDAWERETTEYKPSLESRESEDEHETDDFESQEVHRGGPLLQRDEEENDISWTDSISYGGASPARAGLDEGTGSLSDEGASEDESIAVPLTWVSIPPGSFWRGSSPGEPGRRPDEVRHEVTINRGFGVCTTPVSRALYCAVMGEEEDPVAHPDHPVAAVSWLDAVRFCNHCSERLGLAPAYQLLGERVVWDRESLGVRLLTEAEWEHCARAGVDTPQGDRVGLEDHAWFEENAEGTTHPVGLHRPNAWGLFDLLGNVREWVWDRYDAHPEENITADPAGHWSSPRRVARGAGFRDPAAEVRFARRWPLDPGETSPDLGFRIARTREDPR